MKTGQVKPYKDKINMMELLGEIAPLARTLANNETDRALNLIAEYLPEAVIEGFETGSKVWSWTIPERWEVSGATIKAGGRTLVDVSWNSLHLLNYSQPYRGVVSRDELLKHLHTDPKRPDAIPFRHSFYTPQWGFCVPHSWLSRFSYDNYEVEINASFEKGVLNTLSCHIPGEEESTFIICTNICHPTQANDSLSGLVAAVDIAKRLLSREKRKYSYILLVVPETIGSIAYLANHPKLISSAVGGVFIEMIGTKGPLIGHRTRRGNSYWDSILDSRLNEDGGIEQTVPFMKSASNDEKVLDSPGVDIPTFSLTRYPYPEYHTSDDNFTLIDVHRLREGRDELQQIIDIAENDYTPVLNQPGPIFLSGHGLYPDWQDNPELLPIWNSFLDVMYRIDGRHSVVELASMAKVPLSHFLYWTETFYKKGLISKKRFTINRT
jgi:aminopeptidase-like protein